jgi:hypothetical protein
MNKSPACMNGDVSKMIRAIYSTLGLAIALCVIGLPILESTTAQAQAGAEPTLEEQKADWQGRYRSLLQNEARLHHNAQMARENYARAQRRNYPRGGAREQFLIDADDAEKELVTVKEELAQLQLDARHEAIPKNWLYDVEEEPITSGPPASASQNAAADDDDQDDREGRNPLYFEDEDKDNP